MSWPLLASALGALGFGLIARWIIRCRVWMNYW